MTRFVLLAIVVGILWADATLAQNYGAPHGDAGLYYSDRAAWEAKHAGTCITNDAVFEDTPLGRAAEICARRTHCSDDERLSASAGGISPKFVWAKDACQKVWHEWQANRFEEIIDAAKANDTKRFADELDDKRFVEELAGSIK